VSLRLRLTLSYALVALLCVLMVGALANGVLESTFRGYVRESQERNARQIVTQVGAQAGPSGTWDVEAVSVVGMSALEQGMIVRLTDAGGTTVWDAAVHNNGQCAQMLAHMAQNMESRYPRWHGAYTEKIYPVRSGFRQVGNVAIGYYGPFFLNDDELSFLTTLNRLLLWITIASLALAVGIGMFMARRITVPLARISSATRRITRGERNVRIPETTRTPELDGIASAMNNLSRGLAEQEELRRRLTADMAHELRTPLATLQSHLEAMIDGVWAPDQGRLSGLHEEILRISRMVSDLENLARFEASASTLEKQNVDLGSLVSQIVSNHEPQFHERGVELRLSGAGADGVRSAQRVRADVDPDRVSQAVINLLSNALKFTPAGGSVRVAVSLEGMCAVITVADSGIGIGPEDLPRIFERFYRADASRSRATGGSGIGLSIARAIVEAHGGTITVRSTPGTGSEFRIEFPAATASGQDPERSAAILLNR
jgi:two-component system, OmpR family, sensor histidine kinase BaeS